ncbi:uncharacterized protein LOC115620920 isoform X2 [Scaptodrosophila lebanonensis]|nr:uncharacterized protein LOC115620920 isoform X2 [Scaptodrosophila lebanonensis]
MERMENCGGNVKDCVEKMVDAQDLLFVVGDKSQSFPSSSADPCLSLGFGSGMETGSCSNDKLSKYRHLNMRSTKNADMLDCCDLSGASPRLLDMAGPFTICEGAEEDVGCYSVGAMPGPGAHFALRPTLGDANTNRLCTRISTPRLKQTEIQKARRCPLCKEDVSWLPKISACPHCGYKPVPEFRETTYDEQATAEAILNNLFEQSASDVPSFESIDGGCSEEGGDVDPKNSEDEFDNIVRDFKHLKRSIKRTRQQDTAATVPRMCSQIGGSGGKTEDQPNLAIVFEELKDLFNLRAKTTKTKIREICDEACRLANSVKERKSSKTKEPLASDICDLPKTKKKRKKCGPRRRLPMKSKVYSVLSVRPHSQRLGHAECFNGFGPGKNVPSNMGWLWTRFPLAKRPGWRPGAIGRTIRDLMSYFLKDFPVDSVPVSKYMSYHNQKKPPPVEREAEPEDLVQVPTLHIEKKNGDYIITLRPLKDASTLQRAANPYAEMKPVQFRITKSPLLKQLREVKRCLKNMGFSKCKCHRPVMQCYCRTFIDKKRLLQEVQRQCEKRRMDNCREQLVLSDTTDSEAEFDFGVTPPAGVMKPERLKVVDVVNNETQYCEADWAMPTMFPHPPNALMQYGACTGGERKKLFPWIYGKGNVHQEPKPPKMRNMPKKTKKGAGRQAGGYAGQINDTYTRPQPAFYKLPADLNTADLRPGHLSGPRMQRLAQAAYPPSHHARRKATRHVRFSKKLNEPAM